MNKSLKRTYQKRAAATMLLGLLAASCGTTVSGAPLSTTTSNTVESNTVESTVTPGADGLMISAMVRMSAGNPGEAGTAVMKAGTDVFDVVRAADQNVVISPYSIYVALAMTKEGAKENSAAQLQTFLTAPDPAASVTAVDQAVAEAAAGSEPDKNGKPSTVIESANTLWAQKGLAVQPDYLDALSAGFDTGMYETDFAADPLGSKDKINGWVSERTRQMIPEFLGDEDITESTRAVLVNALYLSAQWDTGFHSYGDTEFHALDGSSKEIPTMIGSSSDYRYGAGDGWESVSIPYQGRDLEMTIIIPEEGSFEAVAGSVDSELLTQATSGDAEEIVLKMPPFSADYRADLSDALIGSGVTDIFDGDKADLSGVAGDPGDLFVQKVIHEAVIEVDEDGTKAAAATAVAQEAGAAPNEETTTPREVTVDRPFLFVIHDTTTNAPLFLGQIVNPID